MPAPPPTIYLSSNRLSVLRMSDLELLLIKNIISAVLDDTTIEEWRVFFELNFSSLTPIPPSSSLSSSSEYELELTRVHGEFELMVEGRLNSSFEEFGIDSARFYSLVKDMQGNRMVDAFCQIISAATSFEVFADAIRDKGKREYLVFILKSWKQTFDNASRK